MSASSPLSGVILVDCAKANAKSGAAIAAERCGYGTDVSAFREALKSACNGMGVEIEELSDLITDQQQVMEMQGEVVAPDTPSDL
jgi:hypothetical protein